MINQDFILYLFLCSLRKHLPSMRCGFLDMGYCKAGWVRVIMGGAETLQMCLNAQCGESVGYCFAIPAKQLQQSNSTVVYATTPGTAVLSWDDIGTHIRLLQMPLTKQLADKEAREWLWDQIVRCHLPPERTSECRTGDLCEEQVFMLKWCNWSQRWW